MFGISSYILFLQLNLSNKFSLIYSAFISVLFYPVVGTPFVDHHSTFFLILAFYSLILAINKKQYFYYIIIPNLFCLSFLSKQTPAVYGLFVVITLILTFCYLDKKNAKKIIYYSFIGSLIAFFLLFLFFLITKIDLSNFFTQYFLFAGSIGDHRFSVYELNLFQEFLSFKFIFYFIFILMLILFNLIAKKKFKKRRNVYNCYFNFIS